MTTRAQYQAYLQSDHWRDLRERKIASGPHSICEACGSADRLDLHHVIYRKILDVRLDDLRWTCRACHDRIHELLKRRLLVYPSECPLARWSATIAALQTPTIQPKRRKRAAYRARRREKRRIRVRERRRRRRAEARAA